MKKFFSYKYEVLIFLSGSLLLSVFMVLQEPSVLGAIDYAELHGFNKFFFKEQIVSGNLPLWNPYVMLGRPFLADIEAACLYPPNLLFALFSENIALILSNTLHFFLGAFSMMILSRLWGVRRFWSVILGAVFAL